MTNWTNGLLKLFASQGQLQKRLQEDLQLREVIGSRRETIQFEQMPKIPQYSAISFDEDRILTSSLLATEYPCTNQAQYPR